MTKSNLNHPKHYPTHMTIRMVNGEPVYSLEYDGIDDPDHHEQEDVNTDPCDWMDANEYIH